MPPPDFARLRPPVSRASIAGMSDDSAADCLVCRKHRERGPLLPGGPVAEDELVLVSHIGTPDLLGGQRTTAYLGQLLVEPRRHAPGLADLTDAEARAVGWWCTRASRGTPREYWGTHVNKWPQARRGNAAEIGVLVRGLRGYLGD